MDAQYNYSAYTSGIYRNLANVADLPIRTHYLILALVASALRLVGLSNEPLWYDEGFTWFIAHLATPEQVIRATLGDVHPPLWYLIEWGVIHTIGQQEWMLRLPSVVFGVIAVLLLYRLCIVFELGRRVAFISALLACFLAAPLYYAQEARVYSLMACAILWMIQAGKQQRWIQFTVAMALTAYCQNLGLFYAASIGLSYVVHFRSRKPLFSSIVAALIWLAWLPGLIQQIHNIQGGFWTTPIDLGWWLNWISTMTFFSRIDGYFMAALYPVAFALCIASVIVAWQWLKTSTGRIYGIALILPPLLAGIVSALWQPVFVHRAFLASGFLIMPLWSMLILDKSKRNAVLVALVPALLITTASNYFPMTAGRGNARELLAPVRDGWQAGDVIYYPGVPESILAAYYLPELPYRMNPLAGDLNQTLSAQSKIDFGLKMEPFSQLPIDGFKRVWVIANVTAGTSSDTLAFLATLQGKATLISHRDYVEIWLLNL